jgi:glycosyltransferase involved in cell wall biosynthesis
MTEAPDSGSDLLSIIIPTYNRAPLLHACLSSCAELDPRAEIILVDDCSIDDTTEVATSIQPRLAARGCKTVLLHTAINSGAPASRNLGLNHARGAYILFVDSDDVINPDGIRRALDSLRQRVDCDFVYGKVQRVDEHLQPLQSEIIGQRCEFRDEDAAGYHWHTMGVIYRKTFLDRVGFWNEQLTGSQDWEFQARAKMAAHHAIFCDVLFGYWRQHESNRIGTRTFRYDYVRSVIDACESIIMHAERTQHYDRGFANAMARKLFIHGLEYAAHGFEKEAAAVFASIDRLPGVSRSSRLFFSLLKPFPATATNLFSAMRENPSFGWLRRAWGIAKRSRRIFAA